MAFWRELAKRDVGVVPTLVTVVESGFRPLSYYQALVADTTGATHPLRPYVSKFMILDWREQVEEVIARTSLGTRARVADLAYGRSANARGRRANHGRFGRARS